MERKLYTEMTWQERRDERNRLVSLQDGLCYHCGKPLSGEPDDAVKKLIVKRRLFPKTFFEYPVHLHHCHKTGVCIGAVHNYCNAVLWQYHGE